MRAHVAATPRVVIALCAATAAALPLYWLRVDIAPLCAASAEAARLLLELAGIGGQRTAHVLQVGLFRAEVGIECTALLPTLALWAALWAAAPTLQRPLGAALAGGAALFALNTLRIAHLAALGALAPGALWLWHLVIWQSVMIASPALCFAIAARRKGG